MIIQWRLEMARKDIDVIRAISERIRSRAVNPGVESTGRDLPSMREEKHAMQADSLTFKYW